MNVPQHIVLFPDGNRRWATEKNLSIQEGYLEGEKNFDRFLRHAKKRGVKVVTVFGFSTENWKRPKVQVDFLMGLLEKYLGEGIEDFNREGARVRVIGDRTHLSDSLKKVIAKVEEATKHNTEIFLNPAVSYGGKWDIINAVKKMVEEKIPAENINEEMFDQYLSTAGLPEPDLIIRAGGEMRLSNFVLWQAAYAELYFSEKMWPDFSEQDLDKALEEFDARVRRFGK